MDCDWKSDISGQDDNNSQQENDTSKHACSHCGQHTHLLNTPLETFSQPVFQKTKRLLQESSVPDHLIYGLKRPPRIFA